MNEQYRYDHPELSGYGKAILKNIIANKGSQQIIVPASQILCFFYEDKKTFLMTLKEDVLTCDLRLVYLKKNLGPCFFRLDRWLIITCNAVESFVYINKRKIKVTVRGRNEDVILNKNKIVDFKNWIMFGGN